MGGRGARRPRRMDGWMVSLSLSLSLGGRGVDPNRQEGGGDRRVCCRSGGVRPEYGSRRGVVVSLSARERRCWDLGLGKESQWKWRSWAEATTRNRRWVFSSCAVSRRWMAVSVRRFLRMKSSSRVVLARTATPVLVLRKKTLAMAVAPGQHISLSSRSRERRARLCVRPLARSLAPRSSMPLPARLSVSSLRLFSRRQQKASAQPLRSLPWTSRSLSVGCASRASARAAPHGAVRRQFRSQSLTSEPLRRSVVTRRWMLATPELL
mmetsp:Transcript_22419/g.70207  ORF Transcript_22419/g.70207 Transcript_22419/m.70207 type:complete len:266 (-) Transcript_22419:1648-2445(-)